MIQISENCLYCGHILASHCQEGKCRDPCLCTQFKELINGKSWIRFYVSKFKDKPDDGRCESCGLNPGNELANKGNYDFQNESWSWFCRSCRTKSEYNKGLRKPLQFTPEIRAKISSAMMGNTNRMKHH